MNNLMGKPLFFLGANSPMGFINKFSCNYTEEYHVYVIKGGPGTGKSTLMKRVANHFCGKGVNAVLCPCTTDTASLDAVIFPDIKVMLLDGTFPHIVEPNLPLISEEIVNLGDCCNVGLLQKSKEKIADLTAQNAFYHQKAKSYIIAAGGILKSNQEIESNFIKTEKIENFIKQLAKKYIVKTNESPRLWVRYLSGVTPSGVVFYKNTINKYAKNVVVINDNFSAVSSLILKGIKSYALAGGQEVICCPCPLGYDSSPEHIILPKLGVAFTTANRYHSAFSENRTVHARRFLNLEGLHGNKTALNYNKKAAAELLGRAAEELSSAKDVHDSLESYYKNAMDYSLLDKIAGKIVKNISQFVN